MGMHRHTKAELDAIEVKWRRMVGEVRRATQGGPGSESGLPPYEHLSLRRTCRRADATFVVADMMAVALLDEAHISVYVHADHVCISLSASCDLPVEAEQPGVAA